MQPWWYYGKNFSKEIAERYFELRKDILTKENVMTIFKEYIVQIPSETYKKERKNG